MLKPRLSINAPRPLRRACALSRTYFGQAQPQYAPRVQSTPSPSSSQTRVRTVFGALVAVGVACTAYGLYEFYSLLTVWPPELRGDLRSAVKAKRQKDLTSAEAFFRKALATADTMSDEQLDILKRTGISIALAEVLPRSQAYDVLLNAHARMQEAKPLGARARVRAIAIAVRLAELARRAEDEERWGVQAVTDALDILSAAGTSRSGTSAEARYDDDGLELPPWVARTDLAAPLERLGSFYVARGNHRFALPLYLRGIEVLGGSPDAQDRCRAAQLMNNIADVLVAHEASPESLDNARQWATKGFAMATKASGELKGDEAEACQRTCVVLLFNLGQLYEMLGDVSRASDLFQAARVRAKDAKFVEGMQQAAAALMRLRLKTATASGGLSTAAVSSDGK